MQPDDTTVWWSIILTFGLGYLGYLSRKRDSDLQRNATAIALLELKMAEKYATKESLDMLFHETTRLNEAAIARVEKSVDGTNASVNKLDSKVDGVNKSIVTLQTTLMQAIGAKKT